MINITFILDQTRSIVWRRRDGTTKLCSVLYISLTIFVSCGSHCWYGTDGAAAVFDAAAAAAAATTTANAGTIGNVCECKELLQKMRRESSMIAARDTLCAIMPWET